ncbi:hypothetical protein BV20DRAFT_148226 [Pilatotrama ljubarskyi]|nr:hypothetical protein BV20DRAFT_148226 [Pilatotrama ljubarskyi]
MPHRRQQDDRHPGLRSPPCSRCKTLWPNQRGPSCSCLCKGFLHRPVVEYCAFCAFATGLCIQVDSRSTAALLVLYLAFCQPSIPPAEAHSNWILGVLLAAIWDESSSSQTENGASDSVFRVYPGTVRTALRELDFDGQIGVAAAVHRRLWGEALNMSSGDEFFPSTDLVHILVRCRTRMMTAPDASEDDRNTLCTYTEEALGQFQAALGKVDCNTVTWSHLGALERLLRTLHNEHTPARPLVRMEFILAVRYFLSTVKSRSDLDRYDRSKIEECETNLNGLESMIQSDNSLPPATGLHSAAVRAVSSSQPSTPSHPVEEHAERSSRSARSTRSDHDDCSPKPTSSQTGLTSCSSAAAVFASQSPLSHPVQEHALEDGPADRVKPPARKDPAHFIAESSSPTVPAAISPRQARESQSVQKHAESNRGHFDRANTAVPSDPGLPSQASSDARFDSRSGAASTSQSHPLHHVQTQAEDVSSAANPNPSDSVEPCEASKSDPPSSSGLAYGSSPAGLSSKSRFAPAPPPDDEQKDNNLPSSPATVETVEQACDTPHPQAVCTSASTESLPPPNSA